MNTPAWDAKLYNDKHAFVWEKAKGVLELLAAKPGETDPGRWLWHRPFDRANRRERREHYRA